MAIRRTQPPHRDVCIVVHEKGDDAKAIGPSTILSANFTTKFTTVFLGQDRIDVVFASRAPKSGSNGLKLSVKY